MCNMFNWNLIKIFKLIANINTNEVNRKQLKNRRGPTQTTKRGLLISTYSMLMDFLLTMAPFVFQTLV
jgi:hypothetical protein